MWPKNGLVCPKICAFPANLVPCWLVGSWRAALLIERLPTLPTYIILFDLSTTIGNNRPSILHILRLGDLDWMGGAMSGTVYNSSQELGTLMTEVTETEPIDRYIGELWDSSSNYKMKIVACLNIMCVKKMTQTLRLRFTAWQPGQTHSTPTPFQDWGKWRLRYLITFFVFSMLYLFN